MLAVLAPTIATFTIFLAALVLVVFYILAALVIAGNKKKGPARVRTWDHLQKKPKASMLTTTLQAQYTIIAENEQVCYSYKHTGIYVTNPA